MALRIANTVPKFAKGKTKSKNLNTKVKINQPTLAYGRKPNQKPVLNSKYIRQPMLTVGLLSGISPKAAVGKRRARRKRND